MRDLWDKIVAHGKQLSDINNNAFMLWTWLPSHHFGTKVHGDYVGEFQPNPEDILKEACMYVSALHHPDLIEKEELSWFGCACEECEEPSLEDVLKFIEEQRGKSESGT